MICFITTLLSAVSASLYSDLYKIDDKYCAYEKIVFEQSCPRFVASFETACSRLHALLNDGDDCKKGFVTKHGVCHVRCVFCKNRSDICFGYRLQENEFYDYLTCFEFKSIGKRLVCIALWMMKSQN